jgi:hypothetical protein
MTLSTALTLLFWWGAAFMTGGTFMVVLALVIAAVAGPSTAGSGSSTGFGE